LVYFGVNAIIIVFQPVNRGLAERAASIFNISYLFNISGKSNQTVDATLSKIFVAIMKFDSFNKSLNFMFA